MKIRRHSIKPTYNQRETGPRFTVEVFQNGWLVTREEISDPFVTTMVHVRGWRVALSVLFRVCTITFRVDGDRDIVEDVMELDDDYKGAHGSTRRADFDQTLERALGDFAATEGEHDGE